MNKLLTTMFAFAVACATVAAQAQTLVPSAENGAKKVAMCVGCHGIVGYQARFPQIHKVPMIAGQSETYIRSALMSYQTGDRKHPSMRAVASSLSPQDILDLAAYYSQLGIKEGDAPPAVLAKAPGDRIKSLIARDGGQSCTTCHGANFNMPNDPMVAKLAGQHADYLFVALKAYKIDGHAKVGRSNGIMSGQAKKFPDNAELKELADYISALPGDLKVVSQSRIHHSTK